MAKKCQKLPMLARFPTLFQARFPARFPPRFPTAFPARFPTEFPKLDADWLSPHPPSQMLNFHQSTLIGRPTYHKSAKVSPTPFPQISWEPQINE